MCTKNDKKAKNTTKSRMPYESLSTKMLDVPFPLEEGYFKSVRALPDFRLEVVMQTGTIILFDFRTRLNTVRFGKLRNSAFFQNVTTDGTYLIFSKEGRVPVRIAASEFMDLVLVDRTKLRK